MRILPLIAKATWFRNKYSKSFYDNFYNAIFDAFDYAIRHNYPIERNVALDIKSVKTRKKDVPSTRRDVDIEEVVLFNNGWLLHPSCPLRLDHRKMLQLSQYTGLRVGSVRLIEWTDFDWLNGWLIIPVEKQKHRIERAENYQAIYIAITDVLLNIIGGKPEKEPASKWLFPSFMKVRNGETFESPSNPPTAVLNHAFRVREGDIQGMTHTRSHDTKGFLSLRGYASSSLTNTAVIPSQQLLREPGSRPASFRS